MGDAAGSNWGPAAPAVAWAVAGALGCGAEAGPTQGAGGGALPTAVGTGPPGEPPGPAVSAAGTAHDQPHARTVGGTGAHSGTGGAFTSPEKVPSNAKPHMMKCNEF